MSTSPFILRRFTAPESFNAIHPARLHRILEPHRSYLDAHAIDVPEAESARVVSFRGLHALLQNPDEAMPPSLAEAFLLLDALASKQSLPALVATAEQAGIAVDRSQDSAEDVAAQILLHDRELLQHARAHLSIERRRRAVSYHGSAAAACSWATPSAEALRALEQDLAPWFEAHGRGRSVRVHVFRRKDDVSIAIRHGDRMAVVETLDGDVPRSITYRPVKYDVVIYQPHLDTISINAETLGEELLYRDLIGLHLFGRKDYFSGDDRYTLDPLREHGEAALFWQDVEGIEWVKLNELAYSRVEYGDETVSRRSNDVMTVLRRRGKVIPPKGVLVRATFLVKLKGVRRARTVTIRGANLASYMQDAHATVIESWLMKRHFVKAKVAA
ncbi:MAG TPA: hypothetical protein VHF22_02045 [Planctomycetota bacterium]|nr:hypothetical protein [Planctomycetota bacterium]